jgi:hypothetical protein
MIILVVSITYFLTMFFIGYVISFRKNYNKNWQTQVKCFLIMLELYQKQHIPEERLTYLVDTYKFLLGLPTEKDLVNLDKKMK